MLRAPHKYTLLILLVLCTGMVHAQKEYSYWFFGKGLGMHFLNGSAIGLPPPAHGSYQYIYQTSCMSDKRTGELLFYVAGLEVYTRNHTVMPNSMGTNPYTQYLLIVPDPGDSLQYYILYVLSNTLYYAKVDLRLNGGLGAVTLKNQVIAYGRDERFSVVKQLYDAGYWIITHRQGTKTFETFRITKEGISGNAVLSTTTEGVNWPAQPLFFSETVVSTDGEHLGVLDNSSSIPNDKFVLLYDFDKRCGTVSFKKMITSHSFIYDLAFDAETKFLYVTGSGNGGDHSIVQYDLSSNSNMYDTFSTSATVIGSYPVRAMKLGPDNKIYITTEEMIGNGYSPSRYLNVINSPSSAGTACDYQEHVLNLSDVNDCFSGPCYITNRLPSIIFDRTIQQPATFEEPRLAIDHFCLGESTTFGITNGSFRADSAKWDFGDSTASSSVITSHMYTHTGSFDVKFYWYLCGLPYVIKQKIVIGKVPAIELGPDTTLCNGDAMMLTAGDSATVYEWSTGDSIYAIMVRQAGQYSLKAFNGGCMAEDEINVNYYSSLWLAMGDEYFICDKESELVKLDAGEGFVTYKWTPTGDTTQWIIVGDLGDYFVVVKDFRGCSGSDGTKVKRRCPVSVYFPNAFTPNGDGINDVFLPVGADVVSFDMKIYNRWGQEVFHTDQIKKGWDGKVKEQTAPADVYTYTATYSGYIQRKLQQFHASGNLTLLR